MSTQAVIAFGTSNDWRGTIVYADGYGLQPALEALIARDGVQRVKETIMHFPYGWSTVDHDLDQRPYASLSPDGVKVPGYGVAYRDGGGRALMTSDEGFTRYAQHLYLIDDDGNVAHIH